MKIVLEDDSLPHQIRLGFVGEDIGVRCSCMPPDEYLLVSTLVYARQARDVWRRHARAKGYNPPGPGDSGPKAAG